MHALRAAIVLLLLGSTSWAQLSGPELGSNRPDSAIVDSSQVPQRDAFDLIHQLLNKRIEPQVDYKPKSGLQWALLPTFSYNPVYGAAFGVMLSGAGHLGEAGGRYSNLAIAANYSTKQQVQIQARGDVFSAGEDFLFRGDFRHLDTQRSTWGLGQVYSNQEEYPMSFVLQRFYATVMRRVSGPVYLGLGYHWDQFNDIQDERANAGEATPFSEYSGGLPTTTTASGFSVNLLADTRDNLVNTSRGYYVSWSFRDYLSAMGSDSSWQEMWVEARMYPHVPKRGNNVLAFWLYGWFSFGPAPYLSLPANGWDTYGRGARGYLAGRIRGQSQIYMESEYRWELTRDGLWGMVVFANLTSTTRPDTNTFGPLDPGVGAGLRIKFNKNTDTNLTIDYGWGHDDSRGLFLGMTEVF